MKKTRTMKKVASIATAALMTACLAVPMATGLTASAYDVTITDSAGFTHSEVNAYKVFAGSKTDKGLNITGWGNGVNPAGFIADLQACATLKTGDVFDFASIIVGDGVAGAIAESYADAKVAQAVAAIIDGYESDSPKAEAIARIALDNKATKTGSFSDMKVTGLDVGYYVFEDSAAATNDEPATSYSLGMMKVVDDDNISVATKMGYPTFDKNIKDINDSTSNTYEDWDKDADHDMGDAVPFQLVATLPANYDDYVTYKMIFHDDLQENVFDLDKNSFVIYGMDGATKVEISDTNYTITYPGTEDETFENTHTDHSKDFVVTFDNVKAISGLGASDSIFIEYKATLTTAANIGQAGNWNSAYLEYSNNPNYTGDGDEGSTDETTGKTTEETVVAFTYQTIIDKIDGVSKDPLNGAEFTLYKRINNEVDGDGNAVYSKVVKEYKGVSQNQFEFVGLDDGEYKLVETKTPNETYNPIDPIIFTITGVHDGKALTELNGVTSAEATEISLGSVQKGTVDLLNGKISATVENKSGTTLPGTGGIGTTLFYLIGGTMFAGSGVYLISKKRMKNKEEQ